MSVNCCIGCEGMGKLYTGLLGKQIEIRVVFINLAFIDLYQGCHIVHLQLA